MATRVQGLLLGLGKAKQADIATASASFLRFTKLDADITSSSFTTETDKDEVGKGDEFISNVFPVAFNARNRLDKYASAEFVTWAMCYGLGNVAEATGVYTITPINIGTTLELPYFSICEQLPEGGGSALDNLFIGCAMNDFTLAFNSGPGRQSAKMSCNWIGSGKITTPSGVTLPAVTTEHNMLGASMGLIVNGVNYVSAKTILSGSFGWSNNLLEGEGFFPGAGTQSGAALRGRLECGVRVPTLEFTARLLHTSDEYSKLISQSTGTATLSFTYDSTHQTTVTFQSISYEVVENTVVNGIAAVHVVCAVKTDPVNGLISVTSKCGVTGIAQ